MVKLMKMPQWTMLYKLVTEKKLEPGEVIVLELTQIVESDSEDPIGTGGCFIHPQQVTERSQRLLLG